jgi:hypothetical protein
MNPVHDGESTLAALCPSGPFFVVVAFAAASNFSVSEQNVFSYRDPMLQSI